MRRALAAVLLLLSLTSPVAADGGSTLAGLVQNATGISRTYDAYLESVAQVRSAEIVGTFAHRPMPELAAWNWGEVIAFNSGYADPYAQAVIQWMGSPPHRAVLIGGYQRIGCDHRLAGSRHYFVCIVGTVGGWTPPPQPIVDVLPDAAMEAR